MRRIFYIVLIGQLLSCKKGILETRVEGRVTNSKTGKPVEGQTVYLKNASGSFLGNGGVSFPIKSTITDKNGCYEFNFKEGHRSRFYLEAINSQQTDPRFYFQEQISGRIEDRKTTRMDIRLIPKSNILLRLKNTKPFNIEDKINWRLNTKRYGGGGGVEYGPDIDKNYSLSVEGESIVNLHYEITKNNQTIKKDSSFRIGSYLNLSIDLNF